MAGCRAGGGGTRRGWVVLLVGGAVGSGESSVTVGPGVGPAWSDSEGGSSSGRAFSPMGGLLVHGGRAAEIRISMAHEIAKLGWRPY